MKQGLSGIKYPPIDLQCLDILLLPAVKLNKFQMLYPA
jgi:hypothetical protein